MERLDAVQDRQEGLLIDAHAHLDRYEGALESALQEIRQHRILTISTSMDLPSYRRTCEIAAACGLVLPSFGVHPWNASAYASRLEDLVQTIEESALLGEIGLDHFFVEDASLYPAQQKVLEFFLQAAQRQDKIVNLHTKGAEEEVLALLERYGVRRAIVHWYSGPLDILDRLIARGTYLTIGVEVLSSPHIQEIARRVPPDQLLTETDNPGAARWFTGSDGMPRLIRDVIEAMAVLRGTTAQDIAQTVRHNLARLFRGDPRLAEVAAQLGAH